MELDRSKKRSSAKYRYSKRAKRNTSHYVTRQQLHGGQLSVPSNPPNIAYQPWNNTTIVHGGTSGSISMKFSDLCYQLAKQIDPVQSGLYWSADKKRLGTIFNMKVLKIRAWNLTGNMIALSVDDYSDSAKAIADVDALCGLVDTGSSQHVPAVGYELPASHKDIVLRNGTDDSRDTDAVIYHITAPSSDTIMVYVTVLWKFDGPVKFSSFENTITRILKNTASDVKQTRQINNDILSVAKKLEEASSQFSIGNIVEHGVEIAAPYVISAAAADSSLNAISSQLANLVQLLTIKEMMPTSSASRMPLLAEQSTNEMPDVHSSIGSFDALNESEGDE